MSAVEQQAPVWPPRVVGGWSVDDLLHSPDDGQRYEILDGVLLVTPAPQLPHQGAVVELVALLHRVCPSDLRVFAAPTDWQPDPRSSLQPDLMVVRRAGLGVRSVVQAPVLVVEVLSPSTARFDRTVRMSRYAEGGVEQFWLVDPAGPSVQVFDLVDGEYRLVAQGGPGDTVTVDGPVPVSFDPAVLVG